jgi:hypothetical protein
MRALSLTLVALLSVACGKPETPTAVAAEAPQAQPEAPAAATAQAPPAPATDDGEAATSGDTELLFFLNPNGRPCQMQQAIIEEMGPALGVDVREVSVHDPDSRPELYKYGIRSLPALILVDGQGEELHRFTPGIQSAETIGAALGKAHGA